MTLDEQLAMAVNTTTAPVANQQVAAQVVQPTVTAPVQPFTPVQAAESVQTLDLNQATTEAQQISYGVQEISLGEKISTRPIEPVRKLDKGEKIRFTIISNKIGTCRIHNHPTLNKIACFSTDTHYAKCCQDLDEPKLRYYLPVLVYSTMPNDPRTPLPQGESQLRLLVIWDLGSYNQLCEEITNMGNEWRVDFIATAEDTYGKLSFRAQNDSFRTNPEYAKYITAAEQKWETVKDKAASVVRRNMDEEKYIKLTQNAPMPQLQQYQAQDVLEISNL